ncbi:MAG: hypothetical protein M1836_001834 [Candelina mexicana]|nr:MAG: hypothetical protein M1836_001834 [Candelina mexicana]
MDWLYAILNSLAGLQSFLVFGQPFVDAQSLRYLHFGGHTSKTAHAPSYRPWMTRLADCDNITPTSLAMVMDCLPHVAYLDLSGTTAAKDISIFLENRLPSLQILKLRNIGLTDKEMIQIAAQLGTRVWSLDVRNNALTDDSINALLDFCFMPPTYHHSENLPRYEAFGRTNIRSSNVQADGDVTADQEVVILARLMRSQVPSSINHSRTGLSHIYISDNPVFPSGVARLLRSTQLVVLDCGGIGAQASPNSHRFAWSRKDVAAIKSAYERYAQYRLKYLRIHYTCISGVELDRRSTPRSGNADTRPASLEHGSLSLVPSRLGLRYLVLTEVPASSVNGKVSKALKGFLEECAMAEADWASHQPIPRHKESKQHPVSSLPYRSLPSEVPLKSKPFLGTIILEMSESDSVIGNSKSSADLGDDVSANFAESLKGDFSFFNTGKHDSTSINTAKITANPHNETILQEVDVITTIANFRKARYLEHKAATAVGHGGPGAGGHWSGQVRVVQHPPNT